MRYLALFVATLSMVSAEEFKTFRMGSTYGWDFQRPNEKTGTFFGVIPASAVFTYDNNMWFKNYPYLTTGFQFGYAMNTFDLRNTDGTRYYTDVSYLVFGLRLGVHYSVMQLVTLQGGMMPYVAAGLGVNKPELYSANDWPDALYKLGFSGYVSLSIYPLRGSGEFRNLGVYVEYAPGLARLSAGLTARTDFAGQTPDPQSPKAQRARAERIEQIVKNCELDSYESETAQNPLAPEFVDRGMLLHVAVFHGCNTILQRLIAAKFDVNQTNHDDETPVFTAIHARNVEALRMLVKAKADLTHVNMDEETPLALAKATKFTEGVKILRAAGAKR